jgi:hypothetical protein
VAVKVAEVQNMARHVLRNALVLWLSGRHINRPCKSGEPTKATGKQKWPTLRSVGIRYRHLESIERVGTVSLGTIWKQTSNAFIVLLVDVSIEESS